jgi:hypothetical protein
MIIAVHVISALLSIVVATFVAFRPSYRKLVAHYALVGSTVVTGTYLMIVFPAHLTTACTAGLTYLAIAAVLTVIAHVRLRTRSSLS